MWNGSFYRRHMPHYQNQDRTYLITFVTHDRWILPPEARDIVLPELVRQHQQTAFVLTAVVMPDHVHIVLQPLWDHNGVGLALWEILRLIKGRTARAINVALQRAGPVWQQETHDYQIRSEESLIRKCEYVAANPARKGLCASPDDWPWLFRWWKSGTG
jgi:REP element-mobilizing transposase RayT